MFLQFAWPKLSEDVDIESLESESEQWGITRLPGSPQFFDLKESRWHQRGKGDEQKVDLLGMDATNISITTRTSNAKDASEFIIWLTEKRNSQKLFQGFGGPFRATHLGRIGQWFSMEQLDREFLESIR